MSEPEVTSHDNGSGQRILVHGLCGYAHQLTPAQATVLRDALTRELGAPTEQALTPSELSIERATALRQALADAIQHCVWHNESASHVTPHATLDGWEQLLTPGSEPASATQLADEQTAGANIAPEVADYLAGGPPHVVIPMAELAHRDGCHLAHVPLALSSCACAIDVAEAYRRLESERDQLRAALRSLIARVRRTGGYASPEEQDVLRAAERALSGAG